LEVYPTGRLEQHYDPISLSVACFIVVRWRIPSRSHRNHQAAYRPGILDSTATAAVAASCGWNMVCNFSISETWNAYWSLFQQTQDSDELGMDRGVRSKRWHRQSKQHVHFDLPHATPLLFSRYQSVTESHLSHWHFRSWNSFDSRHASTWEDSGTRCKTKSCRFLGETLNQHRLHSSPNRSSSGFSSILVDTGLHRLHSAARWNNALPGGKTDGEEYRDASRRVTRSFEHLGLYFFQTQVFPSAM